MVILHVLFLESGYILLLLLLLIIIIVVTTYVAILVCTGYQYFCITPQLDGQSLLWGDGPSEV